MPRAIWSGSISFGLVNVPVKLYSAVREKRVSFHQLEEGTGARIRYRRVSEETGDEVPQERIVKGYEIAKGHHVEITDEEMEAVEPDKRRTIDIEDFVELDEIDPIYFSDTYYLEPDGTGADRAYALLMQSMQESGRVAVGRFVMRSREYLVAVRPMDGLLGVETMHFGDEIASREELNLPQGVEVAERELAAANQLIDSLTQKWDPDRYHDTYRERLLEIIERKAEGEEIVARPPERPEGEVIDLMAALEASLDGRDRAPEPGVEDLSTMTKQQLYQRASELEIEGRSSMSKDELIRAIEKEQGGAERRSA